MTGLEYIVLHVQEPILYVIRKQHRHSMEQTTPIADYYIIAGVVYQAPDLASVISSRLVRFEIFVLFCCLQNLFPHSIPDEVEYFLNSLHRLLWQLQNPRRSCVITVITVLFYFYSRI